jgi:hypothetical protein
MVQVQVDLSDKATLNMRIIKARYELSTQEAINKMLETVGSEF